MTLFERVSSGMVLTSAGRKLLPTAEKVLDAAQRCEAARARSRAKWWAVHASAPCPIPSSRASASSSPMRSKRIRCSRSRSITKCRASRSRRCATARSMRASTTATWSTPTWSGVPLLDYAYRIVGTRGVGRPAPPRVVGRARADAVDSHADDQHAARAARGPVHKRGSSPVIRVQADNEAVMRSLVVAGGGVSLMREDWR